MTLEVLFARAGQSAAFLKMCAWGVAAGAALQCSGWLHRRRQWAGNVWDAIWVALISAGIFFIMLFSGEGVRLYAAAGLALGAALYGMGIRVIVSALSRRLGEAYRKAAARRMEKRGANAREKPKRNAEKAGKTAADVEQ